MVPCMTRPASRAFRRWPAPAMAKAIGVSVSSLQRIWRRHGLRPQRIRRFKLSDDKRLAERLVNVPGLHVDPPAHAVVLSFDEKSRSRRWTEPKRAHP